MKKIVVVFLVTVVLCFAALVTAAYIKSPEYSVERSLVIATEEAKIYPYINSLKQWDKWCAWTADSYPLMVSEYSGPESGIGSTWKWSDPSNEGGAGTTVITGSDPTTGITYDLTFETFGTSKGAISMAAANGETTVTMRLDGSMGNNLMLRVAGLFLNLDSAMGAQFEEGLEKLKTTVEAQG